MKRISNANIICILVIVIIIGITISRSSLPNIESMDYLTSKEDNVSIAKKDNEENTKNGRKFDFYRLDGKWSLMEFEAAKDNKIKITDNSKITKGKLYIVVLSSEYKAIATHKSNGKAEIDLNIPKDGQYFVRIVGDHAGGNLNIKINSPTDIHLSHRSIFD